MSNNYYIVENKRHEADDLIAGSDDIEVVDRHRKRIEPWLSAIFQSEHLNLLLGSGFSAGLSSAAGVKGANMSCVDIHPDFDPKIRVAASKSAARMGRGDANIEDQFRAALALKEGLTILADDRLVGLGQGISRELAKFANSIAAMEADIANSDVIEDGADPDFERLLTESLLSFASRTASRDRLHIFTTNYDRLIEHGFDMIGVRPIDRFVGALSPVFRASKFDVDIHYSPPGARSEARPLEGVVRFTKLHGSIDWIIRGGRVARQALPFGTKNAFAEKNADALMIYPNSSKDIETAFYPYAELFRDFSAALCRPNAALVTYGYGFGDDHVNRIIADMLSLPSTHLVIISYDDPGGRIDSFIKKVGRRAQISLIVGPKLAALGPLVSHFLPKPSIDSITQRRAELLERRGRREPDVPPGAGADL